MLRNPARVGLIDGETAIRQHAFLKQLGCQGADLHSGRFVLPENTVQRFRQRFGR